MSTPTTAAEWLTIAEDEMGVELAKALPYDTRDELDEPCCSCISSSCVDCDSFTIDINDWNVAMEWTSKINPPLAPFRELYMVVFDRERDSISIEETMTWILTLTKPKDAKIYLIAAALAAGKQ